MPKGKLDAFDIRFIVRMSKCKYLYTVIKPISEKLRVTELKAKNFSKV